MMTTPAARRVLALLVLLVVALPASAAVRPFRGFIVGQSVIYPTDNPAIYTGGARAAGIGTQVGIFTKVTDDIVDVTNGWTVGSFTMTALNGDQITGEYQGFTLTDFAAGTLSWVLDATIIGGTGRFRDATGSFEFVASGEFTIEADGSVITRYFETFDGTIEY
jgi:hypothetical protein